MIENTGYAAFNLYHSLQLHFKGKYDYIKYGGKTTMTKEKFLQRADKYFFYRLSRRYSYEELKNFYISNFLEDPNIRPGPLEMPPAEEIYRKWLGVIGSLKYRYTNDVMYLMENYGDKAFNIKNGQYPPLLSAVLEGKVTMETLIILNEILQFFPKWNEKIDDDIIWPTLRMKYEKYAPFLNYDKKVYRDILKNTIKELT